MSSSPLRLQVSVQGLCMETWTSILMFRCPVRCSKYRYRKQLSLLPSGFSHTGNLLFWCVAVKNMWCTKTYILSVSELSQSGNCNCLNETKKLQQIYMKRRGREQKTNKLTDNFHALSWQTRDINGVHGDTSIWLKDYQIKWIRFSSVIICEPWHQMQENSSREV